jgi:hypothetical protein
MRFPGQRIAGALLLLFLACCPSASLSQAKKGKKHEKEKEVWNYVGGVMLETDGSLPSGVCFRVAGRVTSGDFFDTVKRFDEEQGTVFRRGTETVTQFPDELLLSFVIRDEPCPSGVQRVGTRTYLTREMLRSMQLSLYWKRGVELRPVAKFTETDFSVVPIVPYATSLASQLPKRYEWSYNLTILSAGVPLSDSLVLVIRTPDGRIAARVAARL